VVFVWPTLCTYKPPPDGGEPVKTNCVLWRLNLNRAQDFKVESLGDDVTVAILVFSIGLLLRGYIGWRCLPRRG
jgi:hypothetical protein